jgi:opacity protein-like surface antigen
MAVVAGMIGPSAAWAQCTNSVAPFTAFGVVFNPADLIPFAQGGSVNSVVSVLNTVNTAFLGTNTSAFVSAPANPAPNQQGSGAWVRGISGSVETENTGVTTINTSQLGFNTPGSVNCNTTTKTNYSGFQVGHDISILNGGATGANFHIGVTAGYMEADADDKTPGGTFSGNFQVPFAGVYAAFTKGGFFMDGQARWDFYQMGLTDRAGGLFDQDLNAQGISITGNAGYNQQLGGGWFIEPSGGVSWSRVEVDPLRTLGTIFLLNTPGVALPGTVQIDDIESILGRLSLRVGTNFASGGVAWQPFFTASVFHEFAGDVNTRIDTCSDFLLGIGVCTPGAPTVTANLTTDRVGTYGQFGLGTAAAIINTGWLGYARFDYRVGENIEGWNVTGGLRYQFTPEQRGGVKDGPAPTESYNWTGLYGGGSAGITWAREPWYFTDASGRRIGGFVENDVAGALLGGQVGYNLQFGNMVVGVEGDYGWANAKGGVACPNAFFFTCGGETERLASVAGRVGYAWGRALFYGKAGWAGGEVSPNGHQNTGGNPAVVNLVTPINESKWLNGYTYGAGMEFALTRHVSAKAEWMHYDLGDENFQVSSGPEFADIRADGNIVRIGVNIHLNPVRTEGPLK